MNKKRYSVLVSQLDKFLKVSGYVPDEVQFISDSQDVADIREVVKGAWAFDAFFVIVRDGGYQFVAGIDGIIPDNSKYATILILKGEVLS